MPLIISPSTEKPTTTMTKNARMYLVNRLFRTDITSHEKGRSGSAEKASPSPPVDLLKQLKFVADTPDGFQRPLVADTLKLFAQAAQIAHRGDWVDRKGEKAAVG